MTPNALCARHVEVVAWIVSSFVFAVGCAPHAAREDLSVAAHREAAARERAQADADRRAYDPDARADRVVTHRSAAEIPAQSDSIEHYNPTAYHREAAETHTAHARAHETSAAALEAFEAAECRPFAPKVRAACPVGGPIARVEDLRHGVRLVLVAGAPIDFVLAHMRCHLAYARARGYVDLPPCPLYVRGIEIRAGADGSSIEITTSDRAAVRTLQRASRDEPSI